MGRINISKTKRKVYRTKKVRRNTVKRTHMKRRTMKRRTMKRRTMNRRTMNRRTMNRRMKRSNKYKSKYGGSTATISSTYKQEINNHMSKLERIDVEPASFVRISTGAEMHNYNEMKYTIVIPDIINNDGFRKKQTYKVFFKFSNEQIENPYVISKTYHDFDELRKKILKHVKINESEKLDTYKILFAEKLGNRSDYWSNKHTKDYKESTIRKRGLKRSIKLTNFLRLMLHGPKSLNGSETMSAEDNNNIRGLNISDRVKDILYDFLGALPNDQKTAKLMEQASYDDDTLLEERARHEHDFDSHMRHWQAARPSAPYDKVKFDEAKARVDELTDVARNELQKAVSSLYR